MPLSVRTRMALVSSSGLAYGLLLPPFEWAGLAWFALIPLLIAIAGVRPLAAAGYGLGWGMAATLSVAWWFPGMLERYFEISTAGSWLGLVGLALVVDAWPYAIFASAVTFAISRRRAGPLFIGLAFGAAEWLRAHGLVANPFAQIGHSQLDTAFAQLADLTGSLGVGVLVVAVNAALAGLLVPALASRARFASCAATAALMIAAFCYGHWRLAQEYGEGEPMRVALVQGAIARELRWDPKERGANLERYLQLTERAAKAAPEIVFWPEFAVDFYLREPTLERARLLDDVRAAGVSVVLGGSHYAVSGDEVNYFNSVFVIDSIGTLRGGRYDKQRLVPFAEYGPWGDWLRAETAVYSPARSASLISVNGLQLGAFICGEALYPEIARNLARLGAAAFVNPSNDYWFGEPAAAAHQLQIASFRAIENRRYLARPTSTGVSAIVDPLGRVRVRSEGQGAEVLQGAIRASHTVTVYQRLGDAPLALCSIGVLGLTLRKRGSPVPTRRIQI